MTNLHFAALYAGLNILLLVYLGVRTANLRRINKVGHGDAGNDQIRRAVRAHGNASEYIPAGAVGLLFLSLLSAIPAIVVHIAGLSLTLGRFIHAQGLSAADGPSFGRVAGMLLTIIALTVCAGGMIYAAVQPVL